MQIRMRDVARGLLGSEANLGQIWGYLDAVFPGLGGSLFGSYWSNISLFSLSLLNTVASVSDPCDGPLDRQASVASRASSVGRLVCFGIWEGMVGCGCCTLPTWTTGFSQRTIV